MDNLNKIMQPFFDKKVEIEGLLDSKETQKNILREEIDKDLQNLNIERNRLELKLKRLKENKDREIEEYIKDNFSSQPSFYSGYGAAIKKDLERAYEEKENEIINQIKDLDNQIETTRSHFSENINTVNKKTNYDRVYIRELAEYKSEIRKQLLAYQKELISELKREKLNFDRIMIDLSEFKYEYNNKHEVTNSDIWKNLFETSNKSSKRKQLLTDELKKLDEYLLLIELTNEETASLMTQLTPTEKAEYDRRRENSSTTAIVEPSNINITTPFTENNDLPVLANQSNESQQIEVEEEQSENIDEIYQSEEITNSDDNHPYVSSEEIGNMVKNLRNRIPEDLVDSYLSVDPEQHFDGSMTFVDNFDNLAGVIYNDIESLATSLNSIKIDESSKNLDKRYISDRQSGSPDYEFRGAIELPQVERSDVSISTALELKKGVYINQDDINNAIDNYYNKENKGNKFFIKEINQKITVSKQDMLKLKAAIKNCTIINLMRDKKLSEFDVKRVKVKEAYGDNYFEIGAIETKVSEGNYIRRDELLYELKRMFSDKSKRLKWLEIVKGKIKSSRSQSTESVESSFDELEQDQYEINESEYTNRIK